MMHCAMRWSSWAEVLRRGIRMKRFLILVVLVSGCAYHIDKGEDAVVTVLPGEATFQTSMTPIQGCQFAFAYRNASTM